MSIKHSYGTSAQSLIQVIIHFLLSNAGEGQRGHIYAFSITEVFNAYPAQKKKKLLIDIISFIEFKALCCIFWTVGKLYYIMEMRLFSS